MHTTHRYAMADGGGLTTETAGGTVAAMKVLVTGPDGMLGSYVVRVLSARGYAVRGLLQPGRDTGSLDGLALERIEGDIRDEAVLDRAVAGCDAVIHTVASTAVWPARSRDAWRLNYDVVVRLGNTVLDHGVSKLVHIGSANSFAPGPIHAPGTEDNPYSDGRFGLDYQDSKYAAQQWLLREYRTRGLPVSIVNPSFMFGAYDSKPGSGQMILAIHNGKTPGYSRGGKSYVHARDVAVAAANALTRGRDGRCYIASGENLSYREAFSLIAETLGVPSPRRYLPPPVTLTVGALGSVAGSLTGRTPAISLAIARLGNAECYYSNRRAIEELGMPRTPIREAVAEAFSWFVDNGYVVPARSPVVMPVRASTAR